MQRKSAVYLAAAGVGAGLVARGIWRQRRELPLFGKAVLITGEAGDLELALARTFGAEGCRLALSARDPAALERAREKLEARGLQVFTARCDTTDRAQVDGMVGSAVERYGGLDILINHAPAFVGGTSEGVRLEDFEQTMEEMFWGIVYPTIAVVPEMIERRSGAIVNIIAGGGRTAGPRLVPYDSARLAALGFSEGLRTEVETDGITVITVEPDSGAGVDRIARQIAGAVGRGDGERMLGSALRLLERVNGWLPPIGRNGRHGGARWIAALRALGSMATQRYLHS